MALTIEQIAARVDSLRFRNADRDARNQDVLAVRKGQIASVYPDFFPDGVDANVVANFIDIVARDLSEVMAPLPAINCSAANSVSDRARSFADRRTRIASNYFAHSDMAVQMYSGADWYITYGFLPFVIELDSEAKLPRIRLENPVGAYPEFDRYGQCIAFAKRYSMTLGELVAQFPEYERALLGGLGYKQELNSLIEMVRYYDKDQSVIYLPDKNNLLLSQAKNPLGKMMIVVARKPSIDGELRGQFDDILGIQLLRNRFALLAMEAAEKSVQAPIVLPQDVQELQLGGDAVIRTSNPAGVRRVELTLPQGAFTEISRDMAMRELPFTVNVGQEVEKIEIEDMRAALVASLQAYTQAIPQIASSGGDASQIVSKIAQVIRARQKGQTIEDAIEEIFAPVEQVPPAGAPMVEQPSPAPAGAPVGGALPIEAEASGPPDIMSLLSSLTSGGEANASVRTIRRQ
jgi:hypothetical protein